MFTILVWIHILSYELVKKQQTTGGGIVSFKVKGGKSEAWSLINNTKAIINNSKFR